MAEAPGPNETLSPDDVGKILEELLDAQNDAHRLGLMRNVKLREVQAIEATYRQPKDRLLHIIIAFLQQAEPRPTWRAIVDALKSPTVGLTALAKRVEAAHFPDPTSTRDVVAETSANTTVDGNEVKSKPSSLSPAAVDTVENQVKGLHERFIAMKDLMIQGLKKCWVAVTTVVYILTNIRTHEHRVYLEKKHKPLLECKDHLELFGSLNFYWHYLAPDLLDHLIKELVKKHKRFKMVSRKMEVYKKDLEKFRKNTTLTLFCKVEPVKLKEDPPPGFRKMVVKFDWPLTKTIEDVENFRRQYASNYDIQTCAMMLNSIEPGSFTVTWFIPVSVVELMLQKKTDLLTIFEEFNVTRLEIHTSTEICVYEATLPKIAALASASNNSEPTAIKSKEPGQASTEDEKYPFAEQPSEDFYCPVTMGLLLQPNLTSCCGNHLSQEAATRIQTEGGACPVCKEQSWSTMLNKRFQREVKSLPVFCRHVDRGCEWQGDLAAFHDHMESCPRKNGPLMSVLAQPSVCGDGASHHKTITTGPTRKHRLVQLGQQARALVRRSVPSVRKQRKDFDTNEGELEGISGLCFKEGCIYISCQVFGKNIIRTVQADLPDIICRGVGTLRGIQHYKGSFYVVDKGKEQVLKYSNNGKLLQNTSPHFLNDPYGIHVHKDYVLVCDSMNHRVRVLDLELNHCFDIPGIQIPMDITHFKGLYFVTSRQFRSGAIVILDIDFLHKRSISVFITNADETKFDSRIRGICANDEYLYVAERGHPHISQYGGRVLCLEHEEIPYPPWYKLKCVSEFQTQDNTHLPMDIVCDSDNTIYYSAQDNVNRKYFVAKLVHHQKGTMSGNEVIYF